MTPRADSDSPPVRSIVTLGAGVVVVLGSLAFLADARQGVAFFAGGTIALLNFIRIRRDLEGLLTLSPRSATAMTVLRFLARFALVGIALAVCLIQFRLPAIGLLIGLSSPMAGIVIHYALHRTTGGSDR